MLVAALALAGTARALLPIPVPKSGTIRTQWGPTTAEFNGNGCRAFAVEFEGGKKQEMV